MSESELEHEVYELLVDKEYPAYYFDSQIVYGGESPKKVTLRAGSRFVKIRKSKNEITCLPWPKMGIDHAFSHKSYPRFDLSELKLVGSVAESELGRSSNKFACSFACAQKMRRALKEGPVTSQMNSQYATMGGRKETVVIQHGSGVSFSSHKGFSSSNISYLSRHSCKPRS